MTTPQEKMQAFQSAQKFGKQYPGLLESLQEWATLIRASGAEQVIATADAGSAVAVRWLTRLGFKTASDQRIYGKLLFIWQREPSRICAEAPDPHRPQRGPSPIPVF